MTQVGARQVTEVHDVLNQDEHESNWRVKVRLKAGYVFPPKDLYLNWRQIKDDLKGMVRDYVNTNKEGSN
jgi:hypothetical protein